MAFVCTAGDFPPEVINGELVIPIGYDDQNPLSYSVLMGFSPTGGGESEFYWVIVQTNTAEDTETPFWSGLDTKGIFSQEDRILIRIAVQDAIAVLLGHTKPQRIFCCTHDSDLPQKALLIAAIFKMCGYEVLRQQLQLGKHSWWMELPK